MSEEGPLTLAEFNLRLKAKVQEQTDLFNTDAPDDARVAVAKEIRELQGRRPK